MKVWTIFLISISIIDANNKINNNMKRFLLPIIFLFTIFSCTNKKTEIFYKVSVPEPHTHCFNVDISIKNIDKSYIDVAMPVWSPGSYLIREHQRHVLSFNAVGSSNEPIKYEKINKNTWRIYNEDNPDIKLSYTVYGREPDTHWSFVYDKGGHIIGYSLLMYVKDYENINSQITFNLPDNWKITNTLQKTDAPYTFYAENYHELADNPMLIGDFKQDTFMVDNKVHKIATLNRDDADLKILCNDAKKIVSYYNEFYNGLPYDQYMFIILGMCHGGYEHATGTSIGVGGKEFSYRVFSELASHEFLHVWNVKRIRPPELAEMNYNNETCFNSLWFYEGMVYYYNFYSMVRSGLREKEWFEYQIMGMMNYYRRSPAKCSQSATEASFDAWIKHYRPDENTYNTQLDYYLKGALVSFILSIDIASATDGEKSIDDLLKYMWKKTKHENMHFGTEEIKEVCESIANKSYDDFFERYIYGTEELPFKEYFKKLGLILEYDSTTIANNNKKGYLGIGTEIVPKGVKVTYVTKDAPAYVQGINYGDIIQRINGIDILNEEIYYKSLSGLLPGDTIILEIERYRNLINKSIVVGKRTFVNYDLKQNESPTELELRLRNICIPDIDIIK